MMLSAKDVADHLGCDAKTFRRFVRKMNGGTIGKGNRYAFDASDLDAIASRFDAWRKGANVVIVRFDDDASEGDDVA